MSTHPLNLAVRFLLEIAALLALGLWGWRQATGPMRYLLALGLPLLGAAIWGVFAVPDDPSRSGAAPVAVPGALRLLLELALFGAAVWALFDLGYASLGWIMAAVVVLHYVTSYDRIHWLLTTKRA